MNGRKRKVHRNHLTRHLFSILLPKSTPRFNENPSQFESSFSHRSIGARNNSTRQREFRIDGNVHNGRKETLEEERTVLEGINRITVKCGVGDSRGFGETKFLTLKATPSPSARFCLPGTGRVLGWRQRHLQAPVARRNHLRAP